MTAKVDIRRLNFIIFSLRVGQKSGFPTVPDDLGRGVLTRTFLARLVAVLLYSNALYIPKTSERQATNASTCATLIKDAAAKGRQSDPE